MRKKGIKDPASKLKREELEIATRRMAYAANRRLRQLEKAGYNSGAYRMARRDIGAGRKRYREKNLSKLSLFALQREYNLLSDFLSAKTSTIAGELDTQRKRFETAKARGYAGDMESFNADLERAFTKLNESLFSSDVIYLALTEGTIDLIEQVAQSDRSLKPGQALAKYLRVREQTRRFNEKKR